MQICGIVCEYNPFHLGHAYHISETRRHGADAIVCVMSGDFVQRGEPALLSKHYRAEMALRGGADLVLELPTPWAVSSAERFASGAISLLCALNVVNMLSFGCEDKTLYTLKQAAEILSNPSFYPDVKERMKTGESFAAARDFVLSERAPDCAFSLRSPNNILAVEYLRALPDSVKPIGITRSGAAHDASDLDDDMISASAIRHLVLQGDLERTKRYLPPSSFFILRRAIADGAAPASLSGHDRMILSQLKRMSREDLRAISDVEEGLDARLHRAIVDATSVEDILNQTKTKRYAHARLRRILLCAFLGITREDRLGAPRYARVLGLNDTGRTVLALARKKSNIPIITKPAAAKKLDIAADFEQEVLRHELYSLLTPCPAPGHQDWKQTPIVLMDGKGR